MKLTDLADAAAKQLTKEDSQETIRDVCDQVSGGDLDCMQLDILCTMAEKRIKA